MDEVVAVHSTNAFGLATSTFSRCRFWSGSVVNAVAARAVAAIRILQFRALVTVAIVTGKPKSLDFIASVVQKASRFAIVGRGRGRG